MFSKLLTMSLLLVLLRKRNNVGVGVRVSSLYTLDWLVGYYCLGKNI